jgi:hypothetical protein
MSLSISLRIRQKNLLKKVYENNLRSQDRCDEFLAGETAGNADGPSTEPTKDRGRVNRKLNRV